MTTRNTILATSGISLSLFCAIALILSQLGMTKHRHGDIDFSYAIIKNREMIKEVQWYLSKYYGGERCWSESIIDSLAKWGAYEETQGRWFVPVLLDTCICGDQPNGVSWDDKTKTIRWFRYEQYENLFHDKPSIENVGDLNKQDQSVAR